MSAVAWRDAPIGGLGNRCVPAAEFIPFAAGLSKSFIAVRVNSGADTVCRCRSNLHSASEIAPPRAVKKEFQSAGKTCYVPVSRPPLPGGGVSNRRESMISLARPSLTDRGQFGVINRDESNPPIGFDHGRNK